MNSLYESSYMALVRPRVPKDVMDRGLWLIEESGRKAKKCRICLILVYMSAKLAMPNMSQPRLMRRENHFLRVYYWFHTGQQPTIPGVSWDTGKSAPFWTCHPETLSLWRNFISSPATGDTEECFTGGLDVGETHNFTFRFIIRSRSFRKSHKTLQGAHHFHTCHLSRGPSL